MLSAGCEGLTKVRMRRLLKCSVAGAVQCSLQGDVAGTASCWQSLRDAAGMAGLKGTTRCSACCHGGTHAKQQQSSAHAAVLHGHGLVWALGRSLQLCASLAKARGKAVYGAGNAHVLVQGQLLVLTNAGKPYIMSTIQCLGRQGSSCAARSEDVICPVCRVGTVYEISSNFFAAGIEVMF